MGSGNDFFEKTLLTSGFLNNKDPDERFHGKYKNQTRHKLKAELKKLKKNCNNPLEIKYASKLLRKKIEKDTIDTGISIVDHNKVINEKVWSYARKFAELKKVVPP